MYQDLFKRNNSKKIGMRKSLEDSEQTLMKSQGALAEALTAKRSQPVVSMIESKQTRIDVEFDHVARTDNRRSNEAQLEWLLLTSFTVKMFLTE